MVLEYCDAGSLDDLNTLYGLRESEIAYVANEILKALHFLHSIPLLHRSLFFSTN